MIEASEPVSLIDSNILVYAYDTDEPQKNKVAIELLNNCWKRQILYAVSVQNLSEFFVTVTKKLEQPIPINSAQSIINDIVKFSGFIKLNFNSNTVLRATEIYKITKCHYYDSLIAATMIENGIFIIYTENTKDFSKIPGITAKNPFV